MDYIEVSTVAQFYTALGVLNERIKAQNKFVTETLRRLDTLVEQIELDGVVHSERCGCDLCESYRSAKRWLKENVTYNYV